MRKRRKSEKSENLRKLTEGDLVQAGPGIFMEHGPLIGLVIEADCMEPETLPGLHLIMWEDGEIAMFSGDEVVLTQSS